MQWWKNIVPIGRLDFSCYWPSHGLLGPLLRDDAWLLHRNEYPWGDLARDNRSHLPFSHHLVEFSAQEIGSVLELIFLGLGIAIILIELFVLPTFGLLGFFGILLFLAGLFGLMLPGANAISFDFDTQTLNAAGEAFLHQLAWLCGTLAIGAIVIALLSRYVLPSFKTFQHFVLQGNEQDGYMAVDTAKDFPAIGESGEVVSTLRPAGKVMIHGVIYDAMSNGSFIEKGTQVKVAGYETGWSLFPLTKRSFHESLFDPRDWLSARFYGVLSAWSRFGDIRGHFYCAKRRFIRTCWQFPFCINIVHHCGIDWAVDLDSIRPLADSHHKVAL